MREVRWWLLNDLKKDFYFGSESSYLCKEKLWQHYKEDCWDLNIYERDSYIYGTQTFSRYCFGWLVWCAPYHFTSKKHGISTGCWRVSCNVNFVLLNISISPVCTPFTPLHLLLNVCFKICYVPLRVHPIMRNRHERVTQPEDDQFCADLVPILSNPLWELFMYLS